MVVFSFLSRRINRLVGPTALRHGLTARHVLGSTTRDNALLDALFLIPLSEKMISLEIQEDAAEKLRSGTPSAFDRFATRMFDRLFGKGKDEEYYTLQQVKALNPRIQAYEKYMRPILIPNETWSDVMRWQFNVRFVNFARVEYLKAKYGLDLKDALEAYPKLRMGPQASATRRIRKFGMLVSEPHDEDKEWLPVTPSMHTVMKAFQLESWSRKKNSNAVWKQMMHLTRKLGGQVIDVPGSWLKIAKIPPETNVSSLSIEEILEVAGVAGISSSGSFNLLCEECNIYQLWTREYIDGLAEYLLERTESFEGNTIVIDIGAGDGILAQLLRESFASEPQKSRRQPPRRQRGGSIPSMQKESPKRKVPQVVATDDGSWSIMPLAGIPVESLGVVDALEKYATDGSTQVIVLASWMPMGDDWTALFRDYNVSEYILIGEYSDGNCGHNWHTWGNVDSRVDEPGEADEKDDESIIPLYEAEGWKKVELSDLSKYHLSRFDSAASSGSKTFSFRPKKGR